MSCQKEERLDLYGGQYGMYALMPSGHHDVIITSWAVGGGQFQVRATDAVSGQILYWLVFTSSTAARKVYLSRATDVLLQLESGRFVEGHIIQSIYQGELEAVPGTQVEVATYAGIRGQGMPTRQLQLQSRTTRLFYRQYARICSYLVEEKGLNLGHALELHVLKGQGDLRARFEECSSLSSIPLALWQRVGKALPPIPRNMAAVEHDGSPAESPAYATGTSKDLEQAVAALKHYAIYGLLKAEPRFIVGEGRITLDAQQWYDEPAAYQLVRRAEQGGWFAPSVPELRDRSYLTRFDAAYAVGRCDFGGLLARA